MWLLVYKSRFFNLAFISTVFHPNMILSINSNVTVLTYHSYVNLPYSYVKIMPAKKGKSPMRRKNNFVIFLLFLICMCVHVFCKVVQIRKDIVKSQNKRIFKTKAIYCSIYVYNFNWMIKIKYLNTIF